MIAKGHILKELNKLNTLYGIVGSQGKNEEADFYAKLAFLELCGWVEDSIDDLALRCVKRKGVIQLLNDFSKKLGYVYGFEYDRHFRSVLFQTIGAVGLEKVDKKVDSKQRALLEAALNGLWQKRKRHAHSSLRRSARYLDAPSVTLGQLGIIYTGLVEYEKKMRACGY